MGNKKYKLNMTRPEFLSAFIMDGSNNVYTFEELSRIIPASHDLIYCAYCALIEANIEKSDINYVNADEDDIIVIRLNSKDIAKRIKSSCNKEKVRIGEKEYKLIIDIKGSNVFVEAKLLNPEVLQNQMLPNNSSYLDPEDFED